MAEVSSAHVNGNYAHQLHQGYGGAEQHYAQQSFSQGPQSVASNAATASSQSPDIPKDEVGWYFVEQYYTTLSRTPEKLYLYYNKRSQYVCGNETDKVQVCVGQRAIHDRIKELDFQDCKVRITNVDSQASDVNIVIQVIGEISNKSQPHRKFTQTFVLATQTNGYFVLNDIFRYIVEEEEEAPQQEQEVESATGAGAVEQEAEKAPVVEEAEPAAETTEPKTLPSSEDPAEIEQAAQVVDKEIEEKVVKAEPAEEETPVTTNGVAESETAEATEEEPAVSDAQPEKVEEAQPATTEEEKPKDPAPTPVSLPAKQAPAAPKSSAPKTWASLAASAHRVATPVTPSAPAQQRPAVPASKTAASTASGTASVTGSTTPAPAPVTSASAPAPAPAAPREEPTASDSQDEWTSVPSSHNRQQTRQVNGQQQDNSPQQRGYIKNVQEHVNGPELKTILEKFGKVTYFDIARQKNCAFVDFESPDGYSAAVAANPHQLGADKFWVEERRIRPGSTPYVPRGQYQGGRGGGRGDFRGGRGGNYNARGGRGGNNASSARGGARGGAPQAS